MQWKHTCSLSWLKQRQECLTATDIKDLLPFTPTGRKRTITDHHYLKVLARKTCDLTIDDCKSYDSAARGHILEPYAVAEFNEFLPDKFYHWDDVLIKSKDTMLSYSPDALDVKYDISTKNYKPTAMLEIKSYNPERHLITAKTDKMKLEERWQIACALAVSPTIKFAYLGLYNPSMSNLGLAFHLYDRDDLQEEIAQVFEVEKSWSKWLRNFDSSDFRAASRSEEVIRNKVLDKQSKTVINPF